MRSTASAQSKHAQTQLYNHLSMNSGQGKNYQITYIENYQPRQHRVVDTQNQGIKIINASISYETELDSKINLPISSRIITRDIYLSQVCEVLDLVIVE